MRFWGAEASPVRLVVILAALVLDLSLNEEADGLEGAGGDGDGKLLHVLPARARPVQVVGAGPDPEGYGEGVIVGGVGAEDDGL